MVICNTTISIDIAIKTEWVSWMNTVYIPLMLDTGKFVDARLMKIHSVEDEGGSSFALMLMFKDMVAYREFESGYSKKLDELHRSKFRDRFASFRTLLEEAR